jgi:hypothetical protein
MFMRSHTGRASRQFLYTAISNGYKTRPQPRIFSLTISHFAMRVDDAARFFRRQFIHGDLVFRRIVVSHRVTGATMPAEALLVPIAICLPKRKLLVDP